jgi:hypothetical protein
MKNRQQLLSTMTEILRPDGCDRHSIQAHDVAMVATRRLLPRPMMAKVMKTTTVCCVHTGLLLMMQQMTSE